MYSYKNGNSPYLYYVTNFSDHEIRGVVIKRSSGSYYLAFNVISDTDPEVTPFGWLVSEGNSCPSRPTSGIQFYSVPSVADSNYWTTYNSSIARPINSSSSFELFVPFVESSPSYSNFYDYSFGSLSVSPKSYPDSINWTRPYNIDQTLSDLSTLIVAEYNARDQKYLFTNINLYVPDEDIMFSYWCIWRQPLLGDLAFFIKQDNILSVMFDNIKTDTRSIYYSSQDDFKTSHPLDVIT